MLTLQGYGMWLGEDWAVRSTSPHLTSPQYLDRSMRLKRRPRYWTLGFYRWYACEITRIVICCKLQRTISPFLMVQQKVWKWCGWDYPERSTISQQTRSVDQPPSASPCGNYRIWFVASSYDPSFGFSFWLFAPGSISGVEWVAPERLWMDHLTVLPAMSSKCSPEEDALSCIFKIPAFWMDNNWKHDVSFSTNGCTYSMLDITIVKENNRYAYSYP
jgi:hypothetical protein